MSNIFFLFQIVHAAQENTRPATSIQPIQNSNFEDDDDFFNSVDLPEDVPLQRVNPNAEKSRQMATKPVLNTQTSSQSNRSSKPFEYLKNIPVNDQNLRIVKGCIVTLATKLSVNQATVESFTSFDSKIIIKIWSRNSRF